MAAKSIPPIAAPTTAGYMLLRGSAATHSGEYALYNFDTLQSSTSLTRESLVLSMFQLSEVVLNPRCVCGKKLLVNIINLKQDF